MRCSMGLIGFLVVMSVAVATARENKLSWMEKKSEEASLISLTSATFRTYVNAGPRPYHTLVIFTASPQQCEPCKKFEKVLDPIAKSFHDARLKDMPKKPIFFVTVDASKYPEIFRELGIQTAPYVVLVPPTTSSKTRDLSTFMGRLERQYFMQIPNNFEPSEIYKFIKDRTHLVPVIKRELPIDWKLVLLFTTAGSIIIYYLGAHIWKLRGILCATFVLGFYVFNVSGGQFNRIRDNPWLSRDGWIVHHPREQCIYEAVAVGACYVAASLCAVLIINSQKDRSGGKKEHWATYLASHVPSFMSVSGMVMALIGILRIYTIKSPGYRFGQVGFYDSV